MITVDTNNIDFDINASTSIFIENNNNIIFKTAGTNKMSLFNSGNLRIIGKYEDINGNILDNTCNYVSRLDGNASNYVSRLDGNASNYVARLDGNASNYVARLDGNASNYVLSSSNILVTRMATSSILINTLNLAHFANNPATSKIDLVNPNIWTFGASVLSYPTGSVAIAKTVGFTPTTGINLHIGGDIACDGDISAYYSDERLKTKTGDIKDAVNIINKLHGFYYIPNELAQSYGIKNTKQEIGLSAQDVQKVIPEIVKMAPFDLAVGEDGGAKSKSGSNYLTISYDRITAIIVEAIKELSEEIKNIKEENIRINKKIEIINKK